MDRQTLSKILDLARWAPSGDNTQPWRFEIVADDLVVIHGFDTRDWCVYDLDGRASQMAVGALLETLRLAATRYGLRAVWQRQAGDSDETHLRFHVRFHASAKVVCEPLADAIERRSVQRRPYRTTPLDPECRIRLETAIGPDYRVRWFATPAERRRMAWLMFANAKIRLTCQEAYAVHKAIIDWGQRYSSSRIPEEAVGVDRFTARIMRWVMADWHRVKFFNRYLLGTFPPRIQLDLLPGLGCAAHFAIIAPRPPTTVDDAIAAGIVMQRFWLTATSAGLQLQPEMTPLIFSRYIREGLRFATSEAIMTEAARLARRFDELMAGTETARIVFLGRCGFGRPPDARSLRLELDQLAWQGTRPRW